MGSSSPPSASAIRASPARYLILHTLYRCTDVPCILYRVDPEMDTHLHPLVTHFSAPLLCCCRLPPSQSPIFPFHQSSLSLNREPDTFSVEFFLLYPHERNWVGTFFLPFLAYPYERGTLFIPWCQVYRRTFPRTVEISILSTPRRGESIGAVADPATTCSNWGSTVFLATTDLLDNAYLPTPCGELAATLARTWD